MPTGSGILKTDSQSVEDKELGGDQAADEGICKGCCQSQNGREGNYISRRNQL